MEQFRTSLIYFAVVFCGCVYSSSTEDLRPLHFQDCAKAFHRFLVDVAEGNERRFPNTARFIEGLNDTDSIPAKLLLQHLNPSQEGSQNIFGLAGFNGSPDELLKISRTTDKGVLEVQAATGVTPGNVESLFTHNYDAGDPNTFGAKGLISRVSDKRLFWQTGIGGHSINLHHRDALASIHELEMAQFDKMDRSAQAWASSISDYSRIIDPSPESKLESDIIQDLAIFQLEGSEAVKSYLNARAEALRNVRRQDTYLNHELSNWIGVQMTAQRNAQGKLTVRRLEIDSSLMSAVLASETPVISSAEFSAILSRIHESVDPAVREYTVIYVRGLERLEFMDGGQLSAPHGIRIRDPKND